MTNENKYENEKIAIVGYQAAVDLMIKEDNLFWSQFNALLVTNSIFITAIAIVLSAQLDQKVFPIYAVAPAGMFICLLWVLLTERRVNYRLYYLFCACEIEEKFSKSLFDIFSVRGEEFSKGSEVRFTVKNRSDGMIKHQLPCLGRAQVILWSYLLIATFLAIYVLIFLLSIGSPHECSLIGSFIGFILLSIFGYLRVR